MNKFKIIIFVFIFGAFLFKGIAFLDPDFGWYLKTGELILKKGIPYIDPFSYTMSSYAFVAHEWLTEVIIAKFYPSTGMFGLAVMFALFAGFAVFIQIRKFPLKYSIIPTFLALIILLSFVGIRAQTVTLFFFSVLLLIILDKKNWVKYRFFIPFLFLIWANMHGGFVIGLGVLFLNILLRFIKNKSYKEVIILFLSILVTLINPYGLGLWREVWLTLSDGSLRFSIGEWIPSVFIFSPALWFYFAISFAFLLKFWRKFNFLEKTLYFILAILGFSSIRNMPLFIIFSLPLTIKSFYFLSEESEKFKDGIIRFNKAYKVLFAIVFIIVILDLRLTFSPDRLFQGESSYPGKAIEFLKTKNIKGEIFSEYGWGGYLIWKYPSKKVFIDGRMPIWRQKAKGIESSYAFGDYRAMLIGKKNFDETTKKYNIQIFLLPRQRPGKKTLLSELDNLEEKLFPKQKTKSIYLQLKEKGWKEIYKDDVAVIYEKP